MSLPQRRDDLEVGELQEGAEVILLDPRTEQVVSLNAAAAAVWYLCDGRRDAAAIAREVHAALPDLDAAAAETQVRRMLEELAGLGLLR